MNRTLARTAIQAAPALSRWRRLSLAETDASGGR
jgi:hypothetical protein